MFRGSKSRSVKISPLNDISTLLNDISMMIFNVEKELAIINDGTKKTKITNRIGYLRMCEYYLRNMDYSLEDLTAQLKGAPVDIKQLYSKIAKFTAEEKKESIRLLTDKGYFRGVY